MAKAKSKTNVGKAGTKSDPPVPAPKAATGTAVTPVKAALGGTLVLVQDQMPDHIKQDQARGSENVAAEDLIIPRLEVLQAQSPAVTAGHAEFIQGAKAGDLINSVTNQLYGKEVFVVPVHYSKLWLVWRDRQKGGGFRGSYQTPDEAETRAKTEGGDKEGWQVIDTPTHLCLIVNREKGSVDEIMISMPRTKAKISRQWNSMIRMAGGDRFARVYRVTTQGETNSKGSFFNYAIAQSGFPAKGLYELAEKLYGSIAAGQRRVVMDTTGFEAGERDESPEAPARDDM